MTSLKELNTLKDWAIHYQQKGWIIIPLHTVKNGKCTCELGEKCESPGKHPRVKWRQITYTHPEQIRKWWEDYPDSNIGIKTGKNSGIIVLDVDGEKGQETLNEKHLDRNAVVKTGSGNGYHYYFKHPGYKINNFVRKLPGLDLRADGGLVVAPPSRHISGENYQWIKTPDKPFNEPPAWLIELVEKQEKTLGMIQNQILEGERNETLTSLAGTMRAR